MINIHICSSRSLSLLTHGIKCQACCVKQFYSTLKFVYATTKSRFLNTGLLESVPSQSVWLNSSRLARIVSCATWKPHEKIDLTTSKTNKTINLCFHILDTSSKSKLNNHFLTMLNLFFKKRSFPVFVSRKLQKQQKRQRERERE